MCSDPKRPLGGDICLCIDMEAEGGSRCKHQNFNRGERGFLIEATDAS